MHNVGKLLIMGFLNTFEVNTILYTIQRLLEKKG